MLNRGNSKRTFWMFYSRYFFQGVFKILYTGLGAAGGTYIDILTGVSSQPQPLIPT
jgi:hypothetical protein